MKCRLINSALKTLPNTPSESLSHSVVSDYCMDYSPPGSSVHGIFQVGILEWVAFPFSRGFPNPGTEPRSPARQADSLPSEPPYIPSEKPYIPRANRNSKRYVHPSVHSSTVHKTQTRHRSNLHGHQQRTRERRRDTYTQWNATPLKNKNKIIPFAATRMDLEIVTLSETEKSKYHLVSLICGIWKKKMVQINLFTKQK